MERFHTHKEADFHKESVFELHSLQSPTIIEKLSSEASKVRTQNREMLLKVLSSLQFLLKQGLSIRGHSCNDGIPIWCNYCSYAVMMILH